MPPLCCHREACALPPVEYFVRSAIIGLALSRVIHHGRWFNQLRRQRRNLSIARASLFVSTRSPVCRFARWLSGGTCPVRSHSFVDACNLRRLADHGVGVASGSSFVNQALIGWPASPCSHWLSGLIALLVDRTGRGAAILGRLPKKWPVALPFSSYPPGGWRCGWLSPATSAIAFRAESSARNTLITSVAPLILAASKMTGFKGQVECGRRACGARCGWGVADEHTGVAAHSPAVIEHLCRQRCAACAHPQPGIAPANPAMPEPCRTLRRISLPMLGLRHRL